MNPTVNKNNGKNRRSGPWHHTLAALVAPALLLASGAVFAGTAVPESAHQASNDPTAAEYALSPKATPVRHRKAVHEKPAVSVQKQISKLNLKSSSVMVIDAEDSSVLYSKHADVPMPIASISKLMTALVVLEAGQPMDEYLEITNDDRDTEKGTTSRLAPGTELTRKDLLHLALMASENRAAHALGRNYPGGLDAFIPAMNAKARELGMTSAHFVEPTGLSSQNVSSAADLIKLVSAASHNPTIRNFSTYQSYTVPVGRQMVEFHTTNSLVTKSDWDIMVQKTGYTVDAGRCLVMKALIKERAVVMVLLHSVGKNSRVADAGRVRKWMESTMALNTPDVLRSQNIQ
ncbi:MAG TPA: D-alanyl-D-alanine endopeptidase [Steroidobacteraceae bacterium]